MAWTIIAYSDTGLTTANTVDSPDKLANARQVNLGTANIVTPQALSLLTVSASLDQVENIDYISADNGTYTYYYEVTGPAVPAANDTWNIPVVMDGVLTAAARVGGIKNLEILDGIVERHHIKKSDDVYGAFTEEDPLLVPSKELEYEMVMLFDDKDDEQHVIVETTLALGTMAQNNNAVTYLDGTSGDSVTVPQVASTPDNTVVTFGNEQQNAYHTPGTIYYDYSNQETQKGVARARALGVEGGILNSYVLPDSDAVFLPLANGAIVGMAGVLEEDNHTPLYEGGVPVHNMRVKYGSLHSYELVSPANGMRMTFKPEDLKLGDSGTSPTVVKATDPRPNGRPYYRFKYYKGLDYDHDGFFSNSVPGMEWANAPLVYSKASGSTLNQISYTTTMSNVKRSTYTAEMNAIAGELSQIFGGAAQSISNFQPSDKYSVNGQSPQSILDAQAPRWGDYQAAQRAAYNNEMLGFTGMMMNIAGNAISAQVNYQMTQNMINAQYNNTARAELQRLGLSNYVVAPQLNFPRSESIRDFRGNGIYVIKYSPQQSDYAKLDKILEMYGYKDTKTLEASDFVGRKKFNYVKAVGVQIGGDLPKWLREAVAAQLSSGVRIWHQLPDPSAYTDGTNI